MFVLIKPVGFLQQTEKKKILYYSIFYDHSLTVKKVVEQLKKKILLYSLYKNGKS
jgi:hypothetical protein